ncbi:MAG TPA: hypothetical protein VEC39_07195 [Vicinamibacterales bacterium]|nr:hypothetical protein [Vicinamibacterales bacterium]
MSLTAGRLGPYALQSPLGVETGDVYRARGTRVDRLIAGKLLPPCTATEATT